jgi:hypothetical protein
MAILGGMGYPLYLLRNGVGKSLFGDFHKYFSVGVPFFLLLPWY